MYESKIFTSILIIIAFWLGSYAVTFALSIFEKIVSKTKTSLDDKLIRAVKRPIRYLAVVLGLYYASQYYGVGWNYRGFGLEEIFYILVVLIVGYTASRLLKTFFEWYANKEKLRKVNQTMFVFIRKTVSAVVYVVALILILGHFGVEVGPLLAGLGVAGLAIALGLQETLANLFAALFLVMDKSINIGDWIQMEDGTKAYIEDISWRSVRIRTLGNNTIIVPNSVFVGQKISSYDYLEPSFYTSINVGVAYGSDLEQVEKVSIQAAKNVLRKERVKSEDNEPIIRFKELADSSINFIIIVKVDQVQDEGKIKHELIKEVVKEFRKANIEIPFPQMVIHKN